MGAASDFATLALVVDGDPATKAVQNFGAASEKTAAQATNLEKAAQRQTAQFQSMQNITVQSTHGMSAFAAAQAEAAGHVGEHELGLSRLEKSFARLTEHVGGLNPQVALLAETMGHFALGSIEMVGILGAMALVAYAWEKMTEDARKAQEATDKAIKSLTDLQTKQRLGKNATGDDAALVSVEMANLKIEIDEETKKLAAMHTSPVLRTQLQAVGEDEVLGKMVARYQELGKLVRAHNIELAQTTAQERIAAIEAEKADADRHNAILYAAQDRIRLAKEELTLAGMDAAGKVSAKADYDAETQRIEAQRRVVNEGFEDRIRLAKQAAVLVGLDGDALARARKEQDDFNKGAQARRDGEAEVTAQAIKTEEVYKQQASDLVAFLEHAKILNEEMKKAQSALEQGFNQAFDRIFGHAKGLFEQLGAELVKSTARASYVAMAGSFAGGGDGSLSNAGIAGAVFGGAAVGGVVGYGVGESSRSRTAGALSGAASGALAGAQLGGPWGAAIGAVVGFTAGILGAKHGAEAAAAALKAIQLAETQAASSLASWRAQITGLASDQKAAALLDIKMKYLSIQADIERLEAGKKMEEQRNKDLQTAAQLYALALKKSAENVTGAFSGMVNMVQGYKLQAAIFGASDFGSSGSVGGSGGLNGGKGGDVTVNVVVDGAVIGKAVLKNFKSRAQWQKGDSTKWSTIQ